MQKEKIANSGKFWLEFCKFMGRILKIDPHFGGQFAKLQVFFQNLI